MVPIYYNIRCTGKQKRKGGLVNLGFLIGYGTVVLVAHNVSKYVDHLAASYHWRRFFGSKPGNIHREKSTAYLFSMARKNKAQPQE